MTDSIRNTVARMIRSAPDPTTPEGSEELAERVIGVLRALDKRPVLEDIRPRPRTPPLDALEVTMAVRRIRHITQEPEVEEEGPSARRRILTGLWELIEEVGAHVVAGAIRQLREELEDRR